MLGGFNETTRAAMAARDLANRENMAEVKRVMKEVGK